MNQALSFLILYFSFSISFAADYIPAQRIVDLKEQRIVRVDELRVGEEYEVEFSNGSIGIQPAADYYDYDSEGILESQENSFSKLSDTCAGEQKPPPFVCTVKLNFSPRRQGSFWAKYKLEYGYISTISGLPGRWLREQTIALAVDLPALNDKNPPPPEKQQCASGSIIRVDAQSLGESIPIVGTNFNLNYSTEFAQSYVAEYGLTSKIPSFNRYGWTIDVLNHYDIRTYRLLNGSGTSAQVKRLGGFSSWYVVGLGGGEIYDLENDGTHKRTRFGLTGEIKYQFAFDGGNRISSITDAYGNITTFAYAPGGLSYTITSPFGQVTTVNLNSQQLVSSVVNPNGETYYLTYKTGTDLLESFQKPGGEISTFTYSSTGRLLKDEGQGGNFWTLLEELNVTERKVTMSSALGRSKVYRSLVSGGDNIRYTEEPTGLTKESREKYQGGGDLESSPISSYETVSVEEERFGNPVKRLSTATLAKNGVSSTTTYQRNYTWPGSVHYHFNFDSLTDVVTTGTSVVTRVYNSSTKTFTSTTSAGAVLTEVIDSFERPVSVALGAETPVTLTYNSLGQVSQVEKGTGNSITNTYNAAGFLASSTNARNETTQYFYDLSGRLIQVVRPDLSAIGYSYNSNGKLVGITPPGKLQHLFSFNAFELMNKYDPPALTGVAVKETLYSYNLDKQITSIVRPDTQSAAYTYGSTTGLLSKISLSRGDDIYSYHANTPLVSRIDSADGIRSNFTYYGYDIKSQEQRRVSDDFLLAMIQYGFDANHRKVSRSIRGNFPLFSTISTTLNSDSQPTLVGAMSMAYSYPSGRLATTTLNKISDGRTYDALGNLESYTATYNPTGGSAVTLYSYTLSRDVMGRIVGKTESIQGVTSVFIYTYDSIGRLTGVSRNGVAYSTYSYDDNGNRTTGSVAGVAFNATYDAQDRLVTYNGRDYSYNANGDLTGIQWSPSSASTFTYDAFGKLLTAISPLGSTGYSMDGRGNLVRILNGGTTLTRYIYDEESRIAGEFTDAGVMWRQFVYATDPYSPDYLVDSTGTVRLIKDHLGSPRLLVKVTDGTVLQRMDYDEFGKVLANTNPTYQPFGFSGGLYLRLPGLVKFGERYYDPEVGRWTTKDPIRFGGGENLYAYVGNDPINFIDPSGLDPGDRFASEEEAAKDAIRFITPRSHAEKKEYGGYIVKTKDGKYYATEPKKDKATETMVDLGCPPEGATADYHTHVPSKTAKRRNEFSDEDIKGNTKLNLRGYLGTPDQGVKVNYNGFIIEGI